MAASGDGSSSEYELAAVYYQILNRRAADGAAYITVRLSPTLQGHRVNLLCSATPEAYVVLGPHVTVSWHTHMS